MWDKGHIKMAGVGKCVWATSAGTVPQRFNAVGDSPSTL
ncbi:hypothetical protein J2S19_002676 [Metabacillus malikii]|uniref:Uncharacterized protein n=1 Tax=Metabacillus malikii TaxID=1504265 RepID=A0ABT9ZIL8_9BACI|nr:hypothetical protein [Metabacillus malikii]